MEKTCGILPLIICMYFTHTWTKRFAHYYLTSLLFHQPHTHCFESSLDQTSAATICPAALFLVWIQAQTQFPCLWGFWLDIYGSHPNLVLLSAPLKTSLGGPLIYKVYYLLNVCLSPILRCNRDKLPDQKTITTAVDDLAVMDIEFAFIIVVLESVLKVSLQRKLHIVCVFYLSDNGWMFFTRLSSCFYLF